MGRWDGLKQRMETAATIYDLYFLVGWYPDFIREKSEFENGFLWQLYALTILGQSYSQFILLIMFIIIIIIIIVIDQHYCY